MELPSHALDRLASLILDRTHPSMSRDATSLRIVVVEDSPVALGVICSYLRSLPGVQVAGVARHAWQGLVLVEELEPDAVLMDIHLPDMSGVDTVSILAREFPQLHVVMVSVHDSPEVQQACRQRGAHGFVSKRHLFEQLRPTIEALQQGSKPAWLGARAAD
jgi:DNA-binding NarL/FixJ family response regulator